MRKGLVALALLFLAAHLPFLPPTLEDIDSINFALGVRDFDVARHQPHPPGYPIFIALGKISTSIVRAAGVPGSEVRGLAIWSAIGGALMILYAGAFFSAVAGDRRLALLTALLMACAPLFWFTALRPLSDMIGLAAAFAALATVAGALFPGRPFLSASWGFESPKAGHIVPDAEAAHDLVDPARARRLIAGALLAGLAIGIRSQTFVMTLPLLAYIVLTPRSAFSARTRVMSMIAAGVGVSVWMVPLVIASGGPIAYFTALGSQGTEDFSGVVMLWTHRTPRVAGLALQNTFVLPWDSFVLAGIVLTLAAAGAALLLWRSPRVTLILALVFLPYAAFHLLFHEVVTVRYALPLVPAVAFLAVTALVAIHRHAAAGAVIALGVYGVVLAVPASAGSARQPSPIFRLLADMKADAKGGTSPVIGMHRRELTETRRPRAWSGGVPGRLLPAPRDYEWLEVTRTWREGGTSPLWFIADPRRTDLALIDAHNRRTTEYRWPFKGAVYVGGARPDEMDWHVYTQPSWFLEQGWALTPEVAGITERDGWGPHRRPSVGWVRRRTGDAMLLLGGRHLGTAKDPPMRAIAEIDGRAVLTTEITPGSFLTTAPLRFAVRAGDDPFAKLTVSAEPVAPGAAPSRVSIEQFDLQPRGVPMLGFDEGWQEPEYNPNTGRSWRWMSERAVLRIVNASGDVTIRIAGENPRKYYKTAPALRVSAGSRELARFRPDRDFTYEVRVPAAALSAAGGRVTLESDQLFIPGDREGTADRRHLSLRMYAVAIEGR